MMTQENNFGLPKNRWATFQLAMKLTPEAVNRYLTLEKIEAYITAELNDEDAAAIYPDVDLLLDASLEHADLYACLYNTALAEKEGRLPIVAHQFSKPAISSENMPLSPEVSLAEKLKEAIVEQGRQLVVHFSAELNSLLGLKPGLVQMGEALLGDKIMALNVESNLAHHTHFYLTVHQDKQNPDFCLLEMRLKIPGRTPFKQDGAVVSIGWPDEEQRAVSDKKGLVIFKDVPFNQLTHLVLKIESPD